MTQWVEIRQGDTIYFKEKSGMGSVVFTSNKGNYFMPAKRGMRIKGAKKPILNNEDFIFSGSTVQSVSGTTRIVKCELLRLSDNSNFFVSEMNLMSYFAKTNRSSLGGNEY